MKQITKFSVNYPVTILMFVLAVLLTGYISLSRLGIDLFPQLNNPRLYIQIEAGNRPPDEIENIFVTNIESQAIRQSDVLNVNSVTRVGAATIIVEYTWGKDMDEAFLDLQKAMSTYAQNSGIDAINISQYDPNSTPVMIIAVKNESLLNLNEVRKVAENYIRNEMIRLEGIADVTLAGQEVAEIVVETNSYLLDAFKITVSDIGQRIQSYNRNVSGGIIEEDGVNYSVKGVGMIASSNDLENLIVGMKTEKLNDGTDRDVPIYLSDVAVVSVKNKDPQTMVSLNGDRCIGLSIFKEPSYNTVKAVQNITNSLESIKKALPGYDFTIVKNQGDFIGGAIKEVRQSALIGILLAVIVLFVFLRRINSTIVISIAIPVSIIATFTMMYFRGLTLNVMTLGGLALGAGMLVDNAIIVMENIYRHIERGKSVFQSSIDGAAEVGGAISASTLTTIVVFLPIVYLQGASGELFKDMAWTVAFALLSSLVVAILVIPVLVSKIFGKKKVKPVKTISLHWYRSILIGSLKYRWIIIIVSVVLVSASVFLIPKIGSEFMPRSSSNSFMIEYTLPEGTTLDNTNATMISIENMIIESIQNYIESVYIRVGEVSTTAGGATKSSENCATMYISLTAQGMYQYAYVEQSINNIMDQNPDIAFNFIQEEGSLQSTLGNNEAPLIVEVVGEEHDVIAELTAKVKDVVSLTGSLFNVESSIENGAPEIDIHIDRIQAGYFNLSVEQIIAQVTNRLQGLDAGSYEVEGEIRDITIKQPKVTVKQLKDMEIISGTNRLRLTDLATITLEQLPREIHRSNQSRVGKVSAYVLDGEAFDHVVKALEERLRDVPVPHNYRIRIAGEEIKRKESMSGLTFALVLSVILVYMVMASQFESLVHPFSILLTIPLAMVGAIVTFYIIGKPLSIMAYIGMIMLAGIAVNNSIILVDTINQLRAEGQNKRDAIINAGLQRIRPIVMTSLTTILALLPLTFGFGESADLRSPMAWAVVGGLITSTLLSLVVIPCVYDVLTINRINKTSNE